MQEQKIKVLKGATLDLKYQFNIFLNQLVGKKGGSGAIALKAIQVSKPSRQLVVKMAPITNQATKRANQQIQIFRTLPDNHPNIIKVIPLKIYSEKHSYIFMEYCKDGTLQNLMSNKNCNFTQMQIFDIFYQIINGYKVLYDRKILHQDLKPSNILIKDGLFKIADFDLSLIMNENSDKNPIPIQGTFPYMALQKLVNKNYYANVTHDIYSLGVIFYMLIMKNHPYNKGKIKSFQDFLNNFQKNPILYSKRTTQKFSIQMHYLFNIILQMITKMDKNRIKFEDILKFIENEKKFKELKFYQQHSEFKTLQSNQIIDQQFLNEQTNISNNTKSKYIVQNQSQSFAIPYDIDQKQYQNYQNKLKQINKAQQIKQKYSQICEKIDKYLISKRLIVYFFDRLCRKLDIEKDQLNIQIIKRKNLSKNKKVLQEDIKQICMLQRLILMIIIVTKKINSQISAQTNNYKQFFSKQWFIYKKKDKIFLKLIKNDQIYLSHYHEDILANTQFIKPKQKQKINTYSFNTLQNLFIDLKKNLIELLKQRNNIDQQNRKSIISLVYIMIAIQIIDNYKQWSQKYQYFQDQIRIIEMKDNIYLIEKTVDFLKLHQISFSINISN